ncbi:aminodeoxychorismate synthase component I [Variovorax sp. OV329]|uniref:aminodeoxychorismate synthase component I n=1 Tax=Variovorax sp. OV329 TaxID=1882825 RepID=UPI0008E859CD|nr:aminodeoxychorismate synthase component I [Variovorax sp. OV329]SFL95401.1 para-aminobenzoate synthetase / 4-amino-4-deoxychorismate lyase [Variovorax sp. OV329]
MKTVTDNNECFALLDDRQSGPARPASRLYLGLEREHRCTDPAMLDAMWAKVEEDLRAGLHAVLLADYEWGARLIKAGHRHLPADDPSALRVLMFRELSRLHGAEVDAWLDRLEPDAAGAAGVMNLSPSVDRAAFTQAIEEIQQRIAAGETYQVNYTFRLHGQVYGSPVQLYRQLRERQSVAYGALIRLPARGGEGAGHVLSLSPELFLRHDQGLLTARPMKGTAHRAADVEGDSETARHLAFDAKNRAENVMIVDLLRNDLGRLAQVGSVEVTQLFEVEPYGTLFQMTSTIEARLRPEVGFADVLRAAYPCGSITGAPKHHTMELIAGLESTPRGLYCGAIGWMDAPQGAAKVGDFCLSVAIRTLTLGAEADGLRPARLGIGAGIVADSRADDEFEECHLKARFLTGLDPGFQLFETMLAPAAPDAPPALRHLDRHLARLGRSAGVLGFRFDRAEASQSLSRLLSTLSPGVDWRVRLALSHDGSLHLQHGPLAPLALAPVTLRVADQCLPDFNPLAAHKTTVRQVYDEGVRAAERAGAFDSLFFTVDGRLVEGGRTSVFLKIAGRWYTPPLADGALPGVLRGCLLEDPAWAATERSLRRADLQGVEAIAVCNALRGVLPAQLLQDAAVPA